MPTPREELIAIQKRLVEELKESIYDTVGRRDPELDAYYRDYQREFRQGYERPSSRNEVVSALMRANIGYFGDFHSLRAAQSTVLDLLREATERGRKIVLAVEMLHAADKHHAQDLLEGAIDPDTFRKRVKWDQSWGFPWSSFQRFFDFSQKHNAPLFGVNINADYREGDLVYRDAFAADLVAALTHLYPERLVAVIYGDLHLAGNHIPAAVEQRLGSYGAKRRTVRVYQNSETLYWKLVEQHLELVVDHLKVQRDVYVVMNATPLVKFQSFANWQHHRSELALEGIAGHDSDLTGETALAEQVAGFIRTICTFFGITLEDPENFEVFTHADLDLLENLVKRKVYTVTEMDALKSYIRMADSAFFVRARALYIGNFSVGNAAEAAARYVLSEMRPAGNDPVAARDEFYGRVMVEGLAFLCSKIINPRRTPRDAADWVALLQKFGRRRKLGAIDKLDVAVAKGFLEHAEYEQRSLSVGKWQRAPLKLFGFPNELHVALTRAIGRALGEKLYHAINDGRVGKELVRAAMEDDVREPDRCRNRYFELLQLAARKSDRPKTRKKQPREEE